MVAPGRNSERVRLLAHLASVWEGGRGFISKPKEQAQEGSRPLGCSSLGYQDLGYQDESRVRWYELRS